MVREQERRVAVVQMCSGPDVAANLDQAEALVACAASKGAELILLPEAFAYLGPNVVAAGVAEPLTMGEISADAGPILQRCARWARQYQVEVLLGGFWERREGGAKVANTSVFLSRSGTVQATYRKMHLYDVCLPDGTELMESATVEAGEDVATAASCCGTLGLSICYDVRFPELYRRLVDRGATCLSIPAAFTLTTGKDHWHVLLRARSVESQCFVFAPAQTGLHYGDRRSYGHALIADPWGVVRAECGDEVGIALADIDLSHVARVRAALPSLTHRRLGTPRP